MASATILYFNTKHNKSAAYWKRFIQNINRFSWFFRCRNQEKFFLAKLSLKIPPHFKCVATLPSEISVS